ncbi:helix-turn-helix domain-containing protein [Actinokineospora sp. NPDC004072]
MSLQEGDCSVGSAPPPEPADACTAAEFTAALRALRTWSGLTYRQLEGKATAQCDTLPASTIATALGRATLPRERFVEAFTRACGLGEDQVRHWLDARRRIAGGDPPQAIDPPSPRWRRAVALIAAAGVGAVIALGATALFDAPTPGLSATPITGLRILAVGSWARIHPARTPELCLTEGTDRTGRYPTAVVTQRPCTQADLPRVFIEPLGVDVVQIQWHHPKYRIGCLTVLLDGPGRDLLEPRDDCADDNPAQRFRLELFGPPAAAHFRIRPTITDHCLSLRDQDTESGAEVVQGRCSGAADQDFLIELIPPP